MIWVGEPNSEGYNIIHSSNNTNDNQQQEKRNLADGGAKTYPNERNNDIKERERERDRTETMTEVLAEGLPRFGRRGLRRRCHDGGDRAMKATSSSTTASTTASASACVRRRPPNNQNNNNNKMSPSWRKQVHKKKRKRWTRNSSTSFFLSHAVRLSIFIMLSVGMVPGRIETSTTNTSPTAAAAAAAAAAVPYFFLPAFQHQQQKQHQQRLPLHPKNGRQQSTRRSHIIISSSFHHPPPSLLSPSPSSSKPKPLLILLRSRYDDDDDDDDDDNYYSENERHDDDDDSDRRRKNRPRQTRPIETSPSSSERRRIRRRNDKRNVGRRRRRSSPQQQQNEEETYEDDMTSGILSTAGWLLKSSGRVVGDVSNTVWGDEFTSDLGQIARKGSRVVKRQSSKLLDGLKTAPFLEDDGYDDDDGHDGYSESIGDGVSRRRQPRRRRRPRSRSGRPSQRQIRSRSETSTDESGRDDDDDYYYDPGVGSSSLEDLEEENRRRGPVPTSSSQRRPRKKRPVETSISSQEEIQEKTADDDLTGEERETRPLSSSTVREGSSTHQTENVYDRRSRPTQPTKQPPPPAAGSHKSQPPKQPTIEQLEIPLHELLQELDELGVVFSPTSTRQELEELLLLHTQNKKSNGPTTSVDLPPSRKEQSDITDSGNCQTIGGEGEGKGDTTTRKTENSFQSPEQTENEIPTESEPAEQNSQETPPPTSTPSSSRLKLKKRKGKKPPTKIDDGMIIDAVIVEKVVGTSTRTKLSSQKDSKNRGQESTIGGPSFRQRWWKNRSSHSRSGTGTSDPSRHEPSISSSSSSSSSSPTTAPNPTQTKVRSNPKKKIYSPYGSSRSGFHEPPHRRVTKDEFGEEKDGLDRFGEKLADSIDSILWGREDDGVDDDITEVPDGGDEDMRMRAEKTPSNENIGTRRPQSASGSSKRSKRIPRPRSSRSRHWKDRAEEQLDTIMGIHRDGALYNRWVEQEEHDMEDEEGTDALSYARGRTPKHRYGHKTPKRNRKNQPFWEEEGSILSVLLGTGEFTSNRRRSSSKMGLQSRLQPLKAIRNDLFLAFQSQSVTIFLRSMVRLVARICGSLCYWASVKDAIPRPFVICFFFAAGVVSRPGSRIKNMIFALLASRVTGELVQGDVMMDFLMGGRGNYDEDDEDTEGDDNEEGGGI